MATGQRRKRMLFRTTVRVLLLFLFFLSPDDALFHAKSIAFGETAALEAADHFKLGADALKEGRRSEAISQWRQYLLLDPESEDALKIRKYLTLLARQEAEAYAKETLLIEKQLPGGRAPQNTIAVAPFKNLGSQSLHALGKGMAFMLIYDLTQVPELQVIERIELQALLHELRLDASGLLDPDTAPRVGNLLKTRHVATGSLNDPERNELHIVTVMVDAEQPERGNTQEAQGLLTEFYDLEKRIACDIVRELGQDCEAMPPAFRKIHTKSLRAFTFWSEGLDALDRGNFTDAGKLFQQAVDEDPVFDLANASLMSTPLPEMSSMTALQMVSGLSGAVMADGQETPWKSVYRSMLEVNLQDAVSMAFSAGKDQRACDCMNMALGAGYSPYAVLKTIFEVGGDVGLDALCECASASGVMKATFVTAARDAVSPANRSVYDIAQITQCPCLRGDVGLAYTPPEPEALPPDPNIPKRTVSAIIP